MLAALGFVVLTVVSLTAAQNAQCSPATGTSWMSNSLGQDPCAVATALGGVCQGGVFSISPLGVGQVYVGPPKDFATDCRCSSVYYSLLSACAICQGNDILQWSLYNPNCTTVFVTVYPENIPPGTAVPHWAYENVTIWDGFNATVAFSELAAPESTGIAQSTQTTPPSTSTQSSPSSALSPPVSGTSNHKSNAGPIAGGVIGGVIFLALVIAAGSWCWRRRRVSVAPSTLVGSSTVSPFPPSLYPSTTPHMSQKLYDPEDPSTFPPSSVSPLLASSPHGSDRLEPLRANRPTPSSSDVGTPYGHGRYTGAAEI